MQCPTCNTKLRKFAGGVICIKNHKFLPGTKIYDKVYNQNSYIDENKLCPICGELGSKFCMCGKCGLSCVNEHQWDPKK